MKKQVLSILLAATLSVSLLSTPAHALNVRITVSGWNPVTGERTTQALIVENEDGSTEELSVYDEQGNQLYIEREDGEWEKLEPPLSPEEVAQRKAAAAAAEEAAAAAEEAARVKKKAELEQTYRIQISEDYAQSTAILETLEGEIRCIPAQLWEKVDAQLAQMGKTLKIEDMRNTYPSASYDGYYTHSKVQIDIAPYTYEIVVPHEYGHLIFMTVLPRLYDSATLEKEWKALTGGEGPAFVSDYAEVSYHEDLAETFFAILIGGVDSPNWVKETTLNYPDCLALKKVDYLRQLLCREFSLDASVFPDLTPSYPSSWAKAEVEEFQSVLGGGRESVVPYQGEVHLTGYQAGATRIQFAYALHENVVDRLWRAGFFGDMTYGEYEDQWRSGPETVNGVYQFPFADVEQPDVPFVSIRAVHALHLNGIVDGKTPTTFAPNGQITRQEAATILYRLCNALGYELPAGTNAFADSDQIASWAQEAVSAVSAAGIMSGVGGDRFDPTGIYTCEQSALSLLRTYKLLAPSTAQ